MRIERLAEIIDDLPYSVIKSGEMEELIVFAIEQAERVQELERDFGVVQLNRALEQDSFKMLEELKGLLEDENKRYREALENIMKVREKHK